MFVRFNSAWLIIAMVLVFNPWFLSAQDLNTIIKKHLQAHGYELWSQIHTIQIDGEWVNESFEKFPLKLTYKSPGKIRMEGTWFGKPYIEATNGKVAWTVAPWTGHSQQQLMGVHQHLMIENVFVPGTPIASFQKSLTLSGLELYRGELFIKLVYDDAYFHREYYLGKDDYILYWEVVQSNVGKKAELIKNYEKYSDYQGLLTPNAIRLYYDDMERELVFEDVTIGIGAPNSIFEFSADQ